MKENVGKEKRRNWNVRRKKKKCRGRKGKL